VSTKFSKSNSKNVFIDTKHLYQVNAVVLNFQPIKKSWRVNKYLVSTKKWSSTTVFNFDKNKKHFLPLEWFLKDHVTLKTGVMKLKIQLWH